MKRKMKRYLVKNSKYSLFVNEVGVMILIFKKQGGIAIRPQIDNNVYRLHIPKYIKSLINNEEV